MVNQTCEQPQIKFDVSFETHECGIDLHKVSMGDNGTWNCNVRNSDEEVAEKAIDVLIITDGASGASIPEPNPSPGRTDLASTMKY